jgi:hypothetical protein
MLKVIAIAVVGMVSLASCKKDYTCECRTGDETAIITTSTIENKNAKDAKKACEAKSGTTLGITKTCKIDW